MTDKWAGKERRNLEQNVAMKQIVKEALKEWLDAKYAAFGKWSLRGILAAIMATAVYFFLQAHGWTPPKL